MKKVFSLLLVTGLMLFLSLNSSGQARLRILQIDSFPALPGDTAHEGQVYHNIRIVVKNVGNSNFWDEIRVFLYSQSIGAGNADTLRDDPFHQHSFLAIDSVDTIDANPNYMFRSIHYAAGDNIIVVWPYSASANFDIFNDSVYFEPLVGIQEPREPQVSIYPNPVSQILYMNYEAGNKVEQVRIYDLAGREIFNVNEAVRKINMSAFDQGLYFMEIIQKDGMHAVKKILVTNN